jgi:hypothetical protein
LHGSNDEVEVDVDINLHRLVSGFRYWFGAHGSRLLDAAIVISGLTKVAKFAIPGVG